MNIVKSAYISLAVALIMLGTPSLVSASVIEYGEESEEEIECREENEDDFLCNGLNGVSGLPFCDEYNSTVRAAFYPNITGCYDREIFPITFCKEFDDIGYTYEYCRQVPESEEYIEYMETGGPDESCLFDVEQIKCLPSPITDECPENFWTNEDGQCFPLNENGDWECPEGYHSTQDDESGQCYPDTEPCYPGHLSSPDTTSCSDEEWVCEEFNMTGCMINGRMIGTFPDAYCIHDPDAENCVPDKNGNCPEGYTITANFTNPRCLPLSFEDAEQVTRERQINDQNRCPPGYELVDIEDADPEDYGNVGKCIQNNDDD